jgi:hypothetical protein
LAKALKIDSLKGGGNMKYICANCGYLGEPKKIKRGSPIIEIFLWLFFIFPGLLYSLWRLITKVEACPKCKAPNMIPEDTPKGQELIAKYYGKA